jgi:hypothetical protein
MKIDHRNQVSEQARMYEIRIQGQLDKSWSDWMEGMQIRIDGSMTILYGVIPDQAALRGILSKIWDVNLSLISISMIDIESSCTRGKGGKS